MTDVKYLKNNDKGTCYTTAYILTASTPPFTFQLVLQHFTHHSASFKYHCFIVHEKHHFCVHNCVHAAPTHVPILAY